VLFAGVYLRRNIPVKNRKELSPAVRKVLEWVIGKIKRKEN
jgi:hypothetical protein